MRLTPRGALSRRGKLVPLITLLIVLAAGCGQASDEVEAVAGNVDEGVAATHDANGDTPAGSDVTHGPVTLSLAHYQPGGAGTITEDYFVELVSQYTDGEVTIEVGYSESLGAAAEIPFLVGEGAVDMAANTPVYAPDSFPNFVTSMMLWWSSGDAKVDLRRQHDIITELTFSDLFMNELAEHGQRPVVVQPLAPYYFFGNDPDCTLEAFAGQRLRSTGSEIPQALQAIGAVPVTMTAPEFYEALDRGTIDRVTIPPTNFVDYDLHEVANQACGPLFWLAGGHTITINIDVWEGLTDSQRDAIERAAAEAQEWSLEEHLAQVDELIAEMEDAGTNIQRLPEADMQEWIDRSPDFIEEWYQARKQAGEGEDLDEVYELLRDIESREYEG